MDTGKIFTPTIIIAILFTLIGFGGSYFLYAENQMLMVKNANLESKLTNLEEDVNKLKNEKSKIEQDLAVLKASGLAKEVELLRLKLNNTEGEIAKVKGEVKPLEATMAKIKLYADAIAAFDQNLAPSPPNPVNYNLKNLGIKISALNDSEVSDIWERSKSNIDSGGDGFSELIQAFFLVISKLHKLLL